MVIKAIIDRKNPQHVHFRLFEGEQERSLGYCGKMCMTTKAWTLFKDAMIAGCRINGDPLNKVSFILGR